VKLNDRISVYTMSEVEKISGEAGSYEVDVKLNPRYVNDKCTGCNACTEACPVEIPNDSNINVSM